MVLWLTAVDGGNLGLKTFYQTYWLDYTAFFLSFQDLWVKSSTVLENGANSRCILSFIWLVLIFERKKVHYSFQCTEGYSKSTKFNVKRVRIICLTDFRHSSSYFSPTQRKSLLKKWFSIPSVRPLVLPDLVACKSTGKGAVTCSGSSWWLHTSISGFVLILLQFFSSACIRCHF